MRRWWFVKITSLSRNHVIAKICYHFLEDPPKVRTMSSTERKTSQEKSYPTENSNALRSKRSGHSTSTTSWFKAYFRHNYWCWRVGQAKSVDLVQNLKQVETTFQKRQTIFLEPMINGISWQKIEWLIVCRSMFSVTWPKSSTVSWFSALTRATLELRILVMSMMKILNWKPFYISFVKFFSSTSQCLTHKGHNPNMWETKIILRNKKSD